jgi:hypothetical protein
MQNHVNIGPEPGGTERVMFTIADPIRYIVHGGVKGFLSIIMLLVGLYLTHEERKTSLEQARARVY